MKEFMDPKCVKTSILAIDRSSVNRFFFLSFNTVLESPFFLLMREMDA